MADDADEAQALIEAERERALNRLRSRPHRPAAEWCADCGAAIPACRQIAAPGCTRCIDCQDIAERRHKRG